MIDGSRIGDPLKQYDFFCDFLTELESKNQLTKLLYLVPQYFNDLKDKLPVMNSPYEIVILYFGAFGLKAFAFYGSNGYLLHSWNNDNNRNCVVSKIM